MSGSEIELAQDRHGLDRIYDTTNPAEVVKRAVAQANQLAAAIEEAGMYTVMGTRTVEKDDGNGRTVRVQEIQKHINVEAWQFCGVMLGVTARTAWTRKVRDDETDAWAPPRDVQWVEREFTRRNGGTYKRNIQVAGTPGKGGWEARVELVTSDGNVIGAAEAECTWDEDQWDVSSSSAVRSMAQTRAEGKAFRSVFGFIPKMAGYAPTPEEEMEGGGARTVARYDVVPQDISDEERLVWSKKAAAFHAPDTDTAKTWWETGMVAAGFERPGGVKNLPVDKAAALLTHLQTLAEEAEAPFDTEVEDATDVEPEVVEDEDRPTPSDNTSTEDGS